MGTIGRPIETILGEWRASERALAEAAPQDRVALEARVADLRDEHRRALAARRNEAEELRGVKR